MDGDDQSKYDQIRELASRDWMKPASVSLQRLDQVKAHVYNFGLADARSLKPSNCKLIKNQQASGHGGYVHEPGTGGQSEPPLSSVNLQNSAWGSNTSIPDLVRQQSGQPQVGQHRRPESAKHQKAPSMVHKKRRPHSAKEPGEDKPPLPYRASMGVKGAIVIPGERPAGGVSQNHGVYVWVAPPNGVDAMSAKEIDSALQDFINGQDDLENIPPPPRGSPDFMQIINSQEQGTQESEGLESSVDGLFNPNVASHRQRKLLRRPAPEPIRLPLHMIGADPNDSSEMDTARLLERHGAVLDTNNSRAMLSSAQTDNTDGEPSIPVVRQPKKLEINLDFQVDEQDPDEEYVTPKPKAKKTRRKKATVKFDEKLNTTVSITPREDAKGNQDPMLVNSGTRIRLHSSRPDLRHVKSKTNSGLLFVAPATNAGGYSEDSEGDDLSSGLESAENTDLSEPESEFPSQRRNKVRPKTGVRKQTLSTVTVEYFEEFSDGEGRDKWKKKKGRTYDKPRPEVQTVIAGVTLSDDDGSEGEKFKSEDLSKNCSQMEHLSLQQKQNFHSRPVRTSHGAPDTHNLIKTIKTLELGDGGLMENKTTSIIEGHVSVTKPRDRVSAYSRASLFRLSSSRNSGQLQGPPSTKTKEPSPDTIKLDDQVDSIAEDRPIAPEPCVTSEDEVPVTETVKKIHPKPKKKRVTSAPVSRPTSAVSDIKKVQRPLSATTSKHTDKGSKLNQAVTSKPSSMEARRANAAAQAMYDGFVTPNREYYHDRTTEKSYASYSKPPRSHSGKKRSTSPSPPVEIWTRRHDFEVETEGVQECKEIQDRLIEAGVPVELETLTRALLPPTEYGLYGPSYSSSAQPLPHQSAGLISKPSLWLPKEWKKLQAAKKAVRRATQALLEQQADDRRRIRSADSTTSRRRDKKKKRGKKGRIHSA